MVTETGIELVPGFSWKRARIAGPYDHKDSFDVFIRSFTEQEDNYFRKVLLDKKSVYDCSKFAVYNCILPKLEVDKMLAGTLFTLFVLVLDFSSYSIPTYYKLNNNYSHADIAGKWLSSDDSKIKTLAVALLNNVSFDSFDTMDDIQRFKTIQATKERFRAIFGEEAYYGLCNELSGASQSPGVAVAEKMDFVEPSVNSKGVESKHMTLTSRSKPTKTIKELQEEVEKGNVIVPPSPEQLRRMAERRT